MIFTDPIHFLRNKVRKAGVLALLESDERLVHSHMAENKHVTQILFASPNRDKLDKVELDFFNNLKAKYQRFGVGFELLSHERSLEREFGREGGPDFGLSL